MYNECNFLTSRHEITIDWLTCHYNLFHNKKNYGLIFFSPLDQDFKKSVYL